MIAGLLGGAIVEDAIKRESKKTATLLAQILEGQKAQVANWLDSQNDSPASSC